MTIRHTYASFLASRPPDFAAAQRRLLAAALDLGSDDDTLAAGQDPAGGVARLDRSLSDTRAVSRDGLGTPGGDSPSCHAEASLLGARPDTAAGRDSGLQTPLPGGCLTAPALYGGPPAAPDAECGGEHDAARAADSLAGPLPPASTTPVSSLPGAAVRGGAKATRPAPAILTTSQGATR